MTPTELKNRLASFYLVDNCDGSVTFPSDFGMWRLPKCDRPHTIVVGPSEHGGIVIDVKDIVQHLVETGETGSYVLMQWLDIADAAVFAGIFEDGDPFENVNNVCLVNQGQALTGSLYDPNGEPSEANDFFEIEFKINGFFRKVTPEIREQFNDCTQLVLMLIPGQS